MGENPFPVKHNPLRFVFEINYKIKAKIKRLLEVMFVQTTKCGQIILVMKKNCSLKV